jgi:hypothetical protein
MNIKELEGYHVLYWYYKEKNLASSKPNEVIARHQFHGALVMFSSIHNVGMDDIIDTLVIDSLEKDKK